MKTVSDILDELSRTIQRCYGELAMAESLRARIAQANGLGGEVSSLKFQVSSGDKAEGAALHGEALQRCSVETKHEARSTKHEARSTKHQARSTTHEAPSTKHEAPSTKPSCSEDPRKVAGARDLPEPFTAVAMGVALGIAGTGPNALLARWERKGWVKRGERRGEWTRTQAFGKMVEG